MRKFLFLLCCGIAVLATGARCLAASPSGQTTSRLGTAVPRLTIDRSPLQVNGTDEGRSRIKPWSSYWFQKRQGRMIQHLRKYDALLGTQAARWEARATAKSTVQWAGYCHAWAAASVMEREPRAPRTVKGPNGRSITLSVADQKAWLIICNDYVESEQYGSKADASGDYRDINPDLLWKCLRTYVKQRGVPLLIDRDPSPAIWNHPVYRYRVTHRSFGPNGLRLGTMEIWMADDNVRPDVVGTKTMKKTYQFTFRLNGKALVAGSAKWYGHSQKDHPDFAWYPTVVKAKNPHVKPATVRRMLGGTRSSATVRRLPDRSSLGLVRGDGASDLVRTAWTER
jgi:hypothetical protein